MLADAELRVVSLCDGVIANDEAEAAFPEEQLIL